MVLPQTIEYITEEEYLAMEPESDRKHEYFEGEIFAMTGASEKHNLIAANVIRELGTQLKKKPCRVYPGDMRLKIEATGLYTYPDVMIVCGGRRFAEPGRTDTLTNPLVIIELLSDSTENYDRGKKFQHYRTLASLREYLLISQHQEKIEGWFRNEKGDWEFSETDAHHPVIIVKFLECELRLDEVYDKV